jgi:hypothetical protein
MRDLVEEIRVVYRLMGYATEDGITYEVDEASYDIRDDGIFIDSVMCQEFFGILDREILMDRLFKFYRFEYYDGEIFLKEFLKRTSRRLGFRRSIFKSLTNKVYRCKYRDYKLEITFHDICGFCLNIYLNKELVYFYWFFCRSFYSVDDLFEIVNKIIRYEEE